MQTNWDVIVIGVQGKAFKGESGNDLTLREACETAFFSVLDSDRQRPQADKIKFYRLMRKIESANSDTVFPAEEISHIKQRISEAYPSIMLVGVLTDLLDPPGALSVIQGGKVEGEQTA